MPRVVERLAQDLSRRERYYNPNLSLAADRFAMRPRRAFIAAPRVPFARSCARSI